MVEATAVSYAALVAILLLLRAVLGDRFWPLALINYFGEYWFAPLPILIAISLWKRRPRALASLSIPTVAFLLMFGGLFLPPSLRAPRVSGLTIVATSFNVLWSNTDGAAIAGAVQAASPDVIGFEELHPQNFDGIRSELQFEYPYHTPPPAAPSGGVGLFSRYPIESAEPFPLPPRNLSLHATIWVGGRRIHVFVVHLSPNNMLGYPVDQLIPLVIERNLSRLAEAARLREIISPIAEPVILLCDCNLSDTSEAYARLAAFLHDSFREAGWGFGHTLLHPPYHFRTQRIDYVWHNDSFVAVEAIVGPEGGSDHLPITAKLVIADDK